MPYRVKACCSCYALADMKKFVTLLACVILVLTGCSANQAKQTGEALAATSALLVALPLIPVAEAYHALNDTNGKSAASFDAWRQAFDSSYSEKTQLIQQRDPVVDARTIAAEGAFAYLPTIPGSSFYPGRRDEIDAATRMANNVTIERNELLRYLQELMADDPKDNDKKEVGYRLNQKSAYPRFSATGYAYKEAFNKEVAALKLRSQK